MPKAYFTLAVDYSNKSEPSLETYFTLALDYSNKSEPSLETYFNTHIFFLILK